MPGARRSAETGAGCVDEHEIGRIEQRVLVGSEVERRVGGGSGIAGHDAAAVLLLVGFGAFGFSYYLAYQSFGAEIVGKAVEHATSAASTAKTKEDAFVKTKEDALKEEEAVKSIIAGQADARTGCS